VRRTGAEIRPRLSLEYHKAPKGFCQSGLRDLGDVGLSILSNMTGILIGWGVAHGWKEVSICWSFWSVGGYAIESTLELLVMAYRCFCELGW